ncbi:MAG TPA: DUF6502 family protein [Woeseiaceae bacterium]|nr:DUF6502 family protein [Woeseiaceae bacterium]
MPSATQRKILEALFRAFRPIARAMLRSGLGYREFAEIAKAAFVNVASSDYGLRGRPTNTSRVAVMTGLTRKEVKRLRDREAAGQTFEVKREVAPGAVLAKWYSHPDFIEDTGEPSLLEFAGEAGSFTDLVKRFGGDIPPGAMRTELLRVGAVEEIPDGRLRALKSVFTPADLDDRLAVALELSLRRLADTILHNTDPRNQDDVHIERTVTTQLMSNADLRRLRYMTRGRMEEFAKSMQDLFSTYESFHEEADEEAGRAVGIGLYYFEEAPSENSLADD